MNSLGRMITAIMAGSLVLSGVATVQASEVPAPGSQQEEASKAAENILRMEIREVPKGNQLILTGDGAIAHQIFKLESPPRLVVSFSAAVLNPTIEPVRLQNGNINTIIPLQDEERGSRLQIDLAGDREYEVNEGDKSLIITVLNAREQGSAQAAPRVTDVKISRTGTGTFIRFLGEGNTTQHQAYRLRNPSRLVVDLMGVENAIRSRNIPVQSTEVSQMYIGGTNDRVRVVIDLMDNEVTHDVELAEGFPFIKLGHGSLVAGPEAAITAVDFSRDGKKGVISIGLNKGDVVMESHREAEDLVLNFKGVTIPRDLVRRMDVTEFGGPVESIDTYPSQDGTARVVVRTTGRNVKHELMQKDKKVLINLTSAADENVVIGENKLPYNGEKVTLDFNNIDIQNALRFLMEVTEHNIIISDKVTGTITMRLVDVPWDQALDLILESRGLGKKREGNIIWIATLDEISQRLEKEVKRRDSQKLLDALVTELIPLNFAKAMDVKKILEGDKTGGQQGAAVSQLMTAGAASGASAESLAQLARGAASGAQGSRVLSDRGSVAIDERTNTLVVTDSDDRLVSVREMVKKLDKPIPQVLIESRIVEMSRDSAMNLGVNWGVAFRPGGGDNPSEHFAISDVAERAYQAMTDNVANPPYSTGGVARSGRTRMTTNQPYNVALGTPANGTIGFHIGSIYPLLDLDVELTALERMGKAKTISSPKVLTVDNEEATIRQGVQVPYATVSDGETKTTFQDAELRLTVTPHVTPDYFITMKVLAKNDEVGIGTVSGLAINKKEVNTNVLVKDGETIVLGGIFTNREAVDRDGIPFLSKVPLLGLLFQNRRTVTEQRELLIFITPQVIEPAAS